MRRQHTREKRERERERGSERSGGFPKRVRACVRTYVRGERVVVAIVVLCAAADRYREREREREKEKDAP
jgi:hypothetical protein